MTIKPESVCIVDFCGRCSLLGHGVDFSADWYPAKGIVRFSGNWGDVPDMPAKTQPTHDDVYAWVEGHPGFLWRKMEGRHRRNQESEARSAEIQKFFDKHGQGAVTAIFAQPDGQETVVSQGCGIHGPLYMLPLAVSWMLAHLPAGSVLRKLEVCRRVPAARGEKPTTKAKCQSTKQTTKKPRSKMSADSSKSGRT